MRNEHTTAERTDDIPIPDLPLDQPTVDWLRAGCETRQELSSSGVTVEARLLVALLDVCEAAQAVDRERVLTRSSRLALSEALGAGAGGAGMSATVLLLIAGRQHRRALQRGGGS